MQNFDFLTVESCFNPFFIDGRQIKRIHFFDKNGIIFSTCSGWFGSNNLFRHGLEIPPAVYKRKIDFSICQSFFVSASEEYAQRGQKFAELYIFVDDESVKITEVKEISEKMTACEVWHSKIYTFEILGKEIRESILDHIEKTPFGEQVDSLLSELESQQIKIGRYDLIQLLKHYNIVKK